MARKPEPSFKLKLIIWDIAATLGTDNYSAIQRELDYKLEELRRDQSRVFYEDTPDVRKIREVVEQDLQRLTPDAVVAKLPWYVWHLRNDYEKIKELAADTSGAHRKEPVQMPVEAQPSNDSHHEAEPLPAPNTVSSGVTSELPQPKVSNSVGGLEEEGIKPKQEKSLSKAVPPDICSASPDGVIVTQLEKWGIPKNKAPDILYQWRSFHREGLHDRCVLYRALEIDLTERKLDFRRAEAILKSELRAKEFNIQFVHRDMELGRTYLPWEGRPNSEAFFKERQSLDKAMLEARDKHLQEIAGLMRRWHNEVLKVEMIEGFERRFEVEDDPLFDTLTYHCSSAVYAHWDLSHQRFGFESIKTELTSAISKEAPPESQDNFARSIIILALNNALKHPTSNYQIEHVGTKLQLWIRSSKLNIEIASGSSENLKLCQISHTNLVREYYRHPKLKELLTLRKRMLNSLRIIRLELNRSLLDKAYSEHWCSSCIQRD